MKDSINTRIDFTDANVDKYAFNPSNKKSVQKKDTILSDIRLHDTWYIDRKRAIAYPQIYKMLYGDD